jgi:D-amino-acid dehydrogenase
LSEIRRDVDVLVIGGGVIGVCAAHYLSQMGRSVTLVERGEICSGASYGNSGLLVPSHAVPLAAPGVVWKGIKWMFNPASPFYIKPRFDIDLLAWLWKFGGACTKGHVRRAAPLIRDLSLASLDLFDELAALEEFEFGFERNGLLALSNSSEGLDELGKEVETLRGIGLEASLLSPAEVAAREPNLQLSIVGAAYYEQDAHLTPDLFVNGLARYLESSGTKLCPHTEVIDAVVDHGQVIAVRTTRGEFAPREVVLSAGSWSAGIGRQLGLRLPIQPAKGYHATFAKPAASPRTPMILTEAKVGVGLMVGKLRFAGTLEVGGLDMSY